MCVCVWEGGTEKSGRGTALWGARGAPEPPGLGLCFLYVRADALRCSRAEGNTICMCRTGDRMTQPTFAAVQRDRWNLRP